jgi:hypothetical protein
MAQEEDLSRTNRVWMTVRRVSWSLPVAACDRCSGSAPRVWETARTAIDLDLDQPVLLEVIVSVHRCPSCRHFFRAQPPFLRADATYTNRVVAKAVASVHQDGMPFRRVARRLARDFWVQPSDRSIRLWCRDYTDGLSLDGDYKRWIVSEFSGILCIDEVYQKQLALLVAVDPACANGDRLVGYQLLHGEVQQADIEQFLRRLRQAGIAPAEVITDASPLYPTVLDAVWPTAAHQLCLFHETRLVVKAVHQVIADVRAELPRPPALQRPMGRFRKEAPAVPEGTDQAQYDRPTRLALVHRLLHERHSQRAIARLTGHSRMTIQRWLREEPPAFVAEATKSAEPSAPPRSAGATFVDPSTENQPAVRPTGTPEATDWQARPTEQPPPLPWESWQQVREYRQALHKDHFLLLRHPNHLTDEDRTHLAELLNGPASETLRVARQFLEDWYAIARDDDGQRRFFDEALAHWRTWHEKPEYRQMPRLRRLLERMDEERAAKDLAFLHNPAWEATNNGAERRARQFRHLQAPCFGLRTEVSIDGALKVDALRGRLGLVGIHSPSARSGRGRRPQRNVMTEIAA